MPYRDHPVEYPPVIGGLMWAAAEVTTAVHSGDGSGCQRPAQRRRSSTSRRCGLALCALVSTWTVARLAGRQRVWDATMVALSPALFMHAFTNWDLAAVALTGLGLWAWSRGSPVWAGALLGVGIATKLYPVFVLLALADAVRAGRQVASGSEGDRRARPAVSSSATCRRSWSRSRSSFPDDRLPERRISSTGWRWFFSLSQTRGADWGSIWLVFQHLFGGDGFGRALSAPSRRAAPRRRRSTCVAAAAVLVVVAGVGALVALAPRRPRVGQIAFLLVAGFVMFNKVDSPQYALWLVPLAVLARPRWASLLIWQASEVVLGIANLYTLISLDHSDQGLPLDTYLVVVVVRDVVLVWLMALVVARGAGAATGRRPSGRRRRPGRGCARRRPRRRCGVRRDRTRAGRWRRLGGHRDGDLAGRLVVRRVAVLEPAALAGPVDQLDVEDVGDREAELSSGSTLALPGVVDRSPNAVRLVAGRLADRPRLADDLDAGHTAAVGRRRLVSHRIPERRRRPPAGRGTCRRLLRAAGAPGGHDAGRSTRR